MHSSGGIQGQDNAVNLLFISLYFHICQTWTVLLYRLASGECRRIFIKPLSSLLVCENRYPIFSECQSHHCPALTKEFIQLFFSLCSHIVRRSGLHVLSDIAFLQYFCLGLIYGEGMEDWVSILISSLVLGSLSVHLSTEWFNQMTSIT